jgi:NADH:ubiquinone oxidoreductase subunit F (NADH-binding)
MAAVAARSGPRVAVANATEGEPLSGKDRTLLAANPHLVLDGLEAAAAAIGAARTIVCVERSQANAIDSVRRAVVERPQGSTPIELALTPDRYVVGQETALVHWLNGGEAKPTFGVRPFERGVAGRPTLVDNVETLANVALIARFGAAWFRQAGSRDEPGTTLVTIAGGVRHPGVLEVPIGLPLEELLRRAGAPPAQAVLIGGYFGTWLQGDGLAGVRFSSDGSAQRGARPGCGVVAVIPHGVCALREVAAVADWYAANSAGQCGACVFGLADIGRAVRGALEGAPGAVEAARRWASMVRGGGACQLPDGAAAFVESALDALAGEVDDHRTGTCSRPYAGYLRVPSPAGWT